MMQMLTHAIKQLIFKRISIIILINQGLYISKNMGNKVNIDLSSLNGATISYNGKACPISKNIAQFLHVMFLMEENPIDASVFRTEYLDYYPDKASNAQDRTGFFRTMKFKFRDKKQFSAELKELICYQTVAGRYDFEEECASRNNWIIKFYTINKDNYIMKKLDPKNVTFPSAVEVPKRRLSMEEFYKIIQESIDEENWLGLKIHITSIFDWTKKDYLSLTKVDAENFLGAYIYAIGKTIAEPQERLESLKSFTKRYDSFLIDYNLSSERLLKEIMQKCTMPQKYLLCDKRSK